LEAVAKKDLVQTLNTKLGVPLGQGNRLFDALVEAIKEELLRGSQVVLKDFAAIKIVEKKAQIVKDPSTGHQYISPAENVVSFVPIDSFQRAIEGAKLSSIILAVPDNDPFARVIEFHFSRVGWTVHIVNDHAQAEKFLSKSGAYLTIVDHALEGSQQLIQELKLHRSTSMVPLIALYPGDKDPEKCTDFMVLGDEHLVEPFEVYTLLMLAESELARSSEEEIIFDQQVNFQFGTSEAHLDRANELGNDLFKNSGLNEEDQVAVSAAFREAIGNAAQHGNRDNPDKLIKVLYLLDKEKITVVVQDEGTGFDHESYTVRAETKSAEDAARERHEQGKVGGLGIKLMLRCSDRLEYNDVGNMITLTKYLRRDTSNLESSTVSGSTVG
jgi:anti-sigma regulatory factor (Ser/Thr protein kinase)/nucleoid DNA-binding protein/CheY-like chemotaxis protein